MLPKAERLRRSSVFQRAYTGRKSVSRGPFTLYVLPRINNAKRARALSATLLKAAKFSEGGERPVEMALATSSVGVQNEAANPALPVRKRIEVKPFVGFVVSKKVCQKATERNRVKRRAREAYRLLSRELRQLREDSKRSLYDVMESLSGWYALVWVLNESAVSASWRDVCMTMEHCLVDAAKKYGNGKSKEKQPRPNV